MPAEWPGSPFCVAGIPTHERPPLALRRATSDSAIDGDARYAVRVVAAAIADAEMERRVVEVPAALREDAGWMMDGCLKILIYRLMILVLV
jgi:hypothetical protein